MWITYLQRLYKKFHYKSFVKALQRLYKKVARLHVFKKHVDFLTAPVVYIEGLRTKLSLFFSCVLGKRSGWKENKKSRESLCIKHRNSILKTKLTILSDSEEGQSLSRSF